MPPLKKASVDALALALFLLALQLGACSVTWAQTPLVQPKPHNVQRPLDQWLMRLHAASRGRAYSGTFVVSTGQFMSSSRIWHVCDGQQQIERVEALTGEPRSTYRRNDQVVTFWPGSRAGDSRATGVAGPVS
jgi:sigma-E factor negative regulatory protein RseB